MPEPRRGRVADAAALNQQLPTDKKKQSKRVTEAAAVERPRPRTRLAARKLKEEDKVNLEESPVREEEEEKEVMAIGNDSGGSNKAAAQEEEGNTAPFPERVKLSFSMIVALGDDLTVLSLC